MADMYGAVRSSYFKVKDPEAFKAWFSENCYFGSDVSLWDDTEEGFAFGGYEMYPSAYPRFPANDEECNDINDWDLEAFAKAFAEQLVPGQNLVVVAAGNEKLRYVSAQRLTVMSDGTFLLDEFYAGN